MASATGELILQKYVMSSGALASGQGRNPNKVLTTGAKNDWRVVNPDKRVPGRRHGSN